MLAGSVVFTGYALYESGSWVGALIVGVLFFCIGANLDGNGR